MLYWFVSDTNTVMRLRMCWMDWTRLMVLMAITFILDHEVIIGCGILVFLIMEAGK